MEEEKEEEDEEEEEEEEEEDVDEEADEDDNEEKREKLGKMMNLHGIEQNTKKDQSYHQNGIVKSITDHGRDHRGS